MSDIEKFLSHKLRPVTIIESGYTRIIIFGNDPEEKYKVFITGDNKIYRNNTNMNCSDLSDVELPRVSFLLDLDDDGTKEYPVLPKFGNNIGFTYFYRTTQNPIDVSFSIYSKLLRTKTKFHPYLKSTGFKLIVDQISYFRNKYPRPVGIGVIGENETELLIGRNQPIFAINIEVLIENTKTLVYTFQAFAELKHDFDYLLRIGCSNYRYEGA